MQIRRVLSLANPPAPRMGRTALPPIPPPSDAGGAWPINRPAARRYAADTLRRLDMSKQTLVLFSPGTANPAKGEVARINPEFVRAVRHVWPDGEVGLGMFRFEASWNMRESVATGVEAMRLVLRELKARGKNVLLAGNSQGSWVVSEALKDPVARQAVTRTAIFGHPSIAATHFHDGSDPTIVETNHDWDRVSFPIKGDKALALEAMIALESDLSLDKLPLIGRALLQNPVAGALAIVSVVRDRMPPPIKRLIPDPHDYSADMLRGVLYLKTGVPIPHPKDGHGPQVPPGAPGAA